LEIGSRVQAPLFVTGTDTGVGKTVVTALMLAHLRGQGIDALATKPFCTGGRGDVYQLQRLQKGKATDDEINPFHFPAPCAPLVASRQVGRPVKLSLVIAHLTGLRKRCERLLIEGPGGLMVPLGDGYTVADLIKALACDVVVVARNSLGTLNHTVLTVEALRRLTRGRIVVVLSQGKKADQTSLTNRAVLEKMLAGVAIFEVPALGNGVRSGVGMERSAKKLKKVLARILH
jgi:dethiobiotin synthetase